MENKHRHTKITLNIAVYIHIKLVIYFSFQYDLYVNKTQN
jgi:hypothetical protein